MAVKQIVYDAIRSGTARSPGLLRAADWKLWTDARTKLNDYIRPASVNAVFQVLTGSAMLASKFAIYLGANITLDATATNWVHMDTAQTGGLVGLNSDASLHLYSFPAGAGAVAPVERLQVSMVAGYTRINTPGNGLMLAGLGTGHYSANLYYDGTNWMRHDTAQYGLLLRMGADSGIVQVYYVAPGANPATLQGPYTLFNYARPPIPYTALGTYAAYNTGWSAVGAPYAASIWRDVNGLVHLGGFVVKGTAVGVGEILFTLNAGFRPQGEQGVMAATGGGPVELRVQTGGAVQMLTAPAGSNNYVALGGIAPFYAYS